MSSLSPLSRVVLNYGRHQGFGLGAPCLALSIGMPFVLPAATTIPTARSILNQLEFSQARSLFTVPSILEDLLREGERAIKALQRLEFLAVGGASVGEKILQELVAHDIKLLNHWGMSISSLPTAWAFMKYFRRHRVRSHRAYRATTTRLRRPLPDAAH